MEAHWFYSNLKVACYHPLVVPSVVGQTLRRIPPRRDKPLDMALQFTFDGSCLGSHYLQAAG
jgi:hypothetical protein